MDVTILRQVADIDNEHYANKLSCRVLWEIIWRKREAYTDIKERVTKDGNLYIRNILINEVSHVWYIFCQGAVPSDLDPHLTKFKGFWYILWVHLLHQNKAAFFLFFFSLEDDINVKGIDEEHLYLWRFFLGLQEWPLNLLLPTIILNIWF